MHLLRASGGTMLVTITAIHGELQTTVGPSAGAAPPETRAAFARLPVSFEAGPTAGRAMLFWSNVVNAGAAPPDPLIGTPFDADASFGSITNFLPLAEAPSEPPEPPLAPLSSPGDYTVRGRIVGHLHTGEGSIVEAGGFLFGVLTHDVAPDALELEPGTQVSFVGRGLTLTASGNPPVVP